MANESSGGLTAARSFGLNVGGAALGGSLSRMLGNPAIATAVQTSVEERKAMIQDQWHRDMDQKFVKLYGQEAQRQQSELEARYVAATKLVPIPMEFRPDAADAMAQAADPKAPPTTPMLGYRLIDETTGDASYISADTPEAVEHFRQVTQEYYGGLQSVLNSFLDATGQYPDNPYIARRAETVINSVTGAIAAKREAAEAAQAQQGMQAQRLGMEAQRGQIAAAEEAQRERGLTAEAEAQEGEALAAEQGQNIPMTKEEKRILAKRNEMQTKREAEELQNARVQRENDAYAAIGADAVVAEGGDPSSMDPRDLAARGKAEEMRSDLLAKSSDGLAKGQPLRPSVDPRGLFSLATTSDAGFERIDRQMKLVHKRYEAEIDKERARILKGMEGDPLMKREGGMLYQQADEDARAANPPIPPELIERETVRTTMYEWAVNSPAWQQQHVQGKGFKTVEEALGTWYPNLYPDWVKKDPMKPLTEDNNMTAPVSDVYEPEEELSPEALQMEEDSKLMPEERMSYKRASSIVRDLESSRYTGIRKPSTDDIKKALDDINREIQLMHYQQIQMAQQQMQSPIDPNQYIAQMEEHGRRYQPVFDMLKVLLFGLPEKERKAWLAKGKGLLAQRPQTSQAKPQSKGLLKTNEDLVNFAKERRSR